MKSHELGYFGNIWVRQNHLPKKGEHFPGHKHKFDHVSLLARGKILVEVEGFKPKEFTAPTFIIIKKDHSHKFTALEDNTLWYCVFALRDENGELTDVYSGDNSPYEGVDIDHHALMLARIEAMTEEETEEKEKINV
jgi:hypothetical protein